MAIKRYSENKLPDDSINEVTQLDFTDDEWSGQEQDSEMKVIKESTKATEYARYTTIDNLTSTDTDKPLSANQGKNLKDAQNTIKGDGYTDENLVDHENRLDTVESDLGDAEIDIADLETGKEDKSNKVTSWQETSTDTAYPSEKLVDDRFKTKVSSLSTTETITVGASGANYTSLNDAIEYLSKKYPQYSGSSEIKAKIEIQPDYTMDEQVLVKGQNLGWIEITTSWLADPFDISAIDEGTELDGGAEQVVDAEIDWGDSDISEMDTSWLLLQAGNGDYHLFYVDALPDEYPDGTTLHKVTLTKTEETEEEVADDFKTEIDGVADFGATVTGSIITITNADVGECASPDGENAITATVTTEGEDAEYATRFTIGSHSFSDGDQIIIKDQKGTIEDVTYNGIWEVYATGTDWVEISQVYDADKVSDTHGQLLNGKTVPIDGDYLKQELDADNMWEFFYVPAFGVCRGTLPYINAIFEMIFDTESPDLGDYLDGFCATDHGEMNFAEYAGIIGAGGTGIYGTRSSIINANRAIASECGRYGFWAYANTILNARQSFATDNGFVAKAEGTGRYFGSSGMDIAPDDISGAGIIATRGSLINAEGAIATGNYSDNVHAEHGALITGSYLEVFGSEVGINVGERYGGMVSRDGDNDGLHTNHLFVGGHKLPEGIRKLIVENKIRNGDFSDGTTNWGKRYGSGSLSVTDKVLNLTGDSGDSNYLGVYQNTDKAVKLDDVLYYSLAIKVDDLTGVTSAQILLRDGYNGSILDTNDFLSSLESDTWHYETLKKGVRATDEFTIIIRIGLESGVTRTLSVDGNYGVILYNLTDYELDHLTLNEVEDLLGTDFFETKEVDYNEEHNNKALSVVDGQQDYHTIGEIDPSKLTSDLHISRWDTRNTTDGSSNSDQIQLPITTGADSQNFRILWGDGTPIEKITDGADAIHTYDEEGIYTIKIYGTLNGFRFNNDGDKEKLLEIQAWGKEFGIADDEGAFYGCSNMRISATDIPPQSFTSFHSWFRGVSNIQLLNFVLWDMSEVTSIKNLFYDSSFNYPIGNWNVSNFTSMYGTFMYARLFNQPIGDWDISNVTSLSNTFNRAESFNQPIGNWNVSNVTSMVYLFNFAIAFNQSIRDWDVSNVINMKRMFNSAESFNQNLTDWDVSACENFEYTFQGTDNFDGDLSGWQLTTDPAKSITMEDMFLDAISFTGKGLDTWNVIRVTNMRSMFYGASQFNKDISNWLTDNVTDMYGMFRGSAFNQPINSVPASTDNEFQTEHEYSWGDQILGTDGSTVYRCIQAYTSSSDGSTDRPTTGTNWEDYWEEDLGTWYVGNVTSMFGVFSNTPFNQDISNWSTSNVENMITMFQDSTFNQDISNWDVKKVTSLSAMFQRSSMNKNLGNWEIYKVETTTWTFKESSMSAENYTDTIVGWANNLYDYVDGGGTLPASVDALNMGDGCTFITNRDGGANFTDAQDARDWLIANGWSDDWGDSTTTE